MGSKIKQYQIRMEIVLIAVFLPILVNTFLSLFILPFLSIDTLEASYLGNAFLAMGIIWATLLGLAIAATNSIFECFKINLIEN
jgi:hypothetical protein